MFDRASHVLFFWRSKSAESCVTKIPVGNLLDSVVKFEILLWMCFFLEGVLVITFVVCHAKITVFW